MTVGHGQMGVRSNLRRFADLMQESALSRRVLLEFSPGVAVDFNGWSLDQGSTYVAMVQRTFDGVIRDIVACESSAGPGGSVGRLDRVETLAECRATPGTYFYDIDATSVAEDTWDEPGLAWDSGLTWDTYPQGTLYVHLYDDVNPMSNDVTVVPMFGFYFSSRGVVHPHLGGNKLSADLSTWTSSSTGTWDEPGATWDAGGATWDPNSGWSASAAASQVTLSSTGAAAGFAQSQVTVTNVLAGKMYRFSGIYTAGADNAGGLSVRLHLKPGAAVFYSDGRTTDANGFIVLENTTGERRRFFADVYVPAYAGAFVFAVRLEGTGAGTVTFEGLKVQRIFRFNLYDPRLSESSVPEVELAATSIFFDRKAVSQGTVTLINADGKYDSIFGQLLLMRRPVRVLVGGVFSDGEELPRDDFGTAFFGHTTNFSATRERYEMPIEDGRLYLKAMLPLRSYSAEANPGMDAALAGSPRAYLWGIKAPFEPVRVGVTAAGYGIYEFVDPDAGPAGVYAVSNGVLLDALECFSTQEEADRPPVVVGVTYNSVLHYRLGVSNFFFADSVPSTVFRPEVSLNLVLCRASLAYPAKLYKDDAGIFLDWTTERGSSTASAAVAVHTTLGLAKSLEFKIQAPDPDVTLTYNTTTQKYTVSKSGGGTLTIKCKTGAEVHRQPWGRMGFNTDVDLSGALSYTAAKPYYVRDATRDDIDINPIRCVLHGYKDDAQGTYTGSPGAPIEKGPDVALMIFRRLLGQPASRVNLASFQAARGTAAGARLLTVHVETPEAVEAILSKIEASTLSDIVIDGDGTIHYRAYSASVPADAPSFDDTDYIGPLEVLYQEKNVYKGIRIGFGADHRDDGEDTFERVDPGAAVKHGRDDVRDIHTYLRRPVDAQAIGEQYFRLATANPRVARFYAASKLVDRQIGDKIKLNASSALGPTGALEDVVFRVTRLRHNYISGVSYCEAVEDVPFL